VGLRICALLPAFFLTVAGAAVAQGQNAGPREPLRAVTRHSGTFNGETVNYTATVFETIVADAGGAPAGSMINTSYVRDGVAHPEARPVTFVFNGGPGASSSPLHMNAFGPRRNQSGKLADNPYSPLDATDLVFIDPIGTGFSRPLSGADGQYFWSVSGDGASVEEFILGWLKANGRENSPRFLCGESYGTVRAGQILEIGHAAKDLGFDGVLLFSLVAAPTGAEMPYVTTLPTLAAAAAFHGKTDSAKLPVGDVFEEAARFARTDYIGALIQGSALPDSEKSRIAREVAKRIGLAPEFVESRNLRIGKRDFMLNLLQDRGLRTGQLDSRVTGELALYANRQPPDDDPSMSRGVPVRAVVGGNPPPTSPIQGYFTGELQFPANETYRSLNLDINAKWKFDVEEAMANTPKRIAAVMREDSKLRVFWAAGYYDITTPLAAGRYALVQAGIPKERLTMALFPTGHSVFEGDENLARFAQSVRRFVSGGAETTNGR
jgi:carboxypeptidase C (cathepsin A)